MANTVSVRSELIRWAIDRSGLRSDLLATKFPDLGNWQSGQKQPTLRELELFAKRTMTPLGCFFLSTPPVEKLEIPDFRTMGDTPIDRLSANLLDTIQDNQRRQQWMRDHLIEQGQEALPFVGSAKTASRTAGLATRIRQTLGLSRDWTDGYTNWEETLRKLREVIEEIGILVSVSGVVGLNNRRKLDPEEFRGFVLCDRHAPLIFVNGADSKSAQMFTLAHELAHIWLGKDGIFNLIQTMPAENETERFCNQVAAEFLIPAERLRVKWPDVESAEKPFHRLSRWFKVSPIVAARRVLDMGLIDRARFFAFYNKYQQELQAAKQKKESAGGNFYATQNVRLGRRFSYAVVQAVREGQLLYRDAYQLTGLKGDTFERYAARLTQKERGGAA